MGTETWAWAVYAVLIVHGSSTETQWDEKGVAAAERPTLWRRASAALEAGWTHATAAWRDPGAGTQPNQILIRRDDLRAGAITMALPPRTGPQLIRVELFDDTVSVTMARHPHHFTVDQPKVVVGVIPGPLPAKGQSAVGYDAALAVKQRAYRLQASQRQTALDRQDWSAWLRGDDFMAATLAQSGTSRPTAEIHRVGYTPKAVTESVDPRVPRRLPSNLPIGRPSRPSWGLARTAEVTVRFEQARLEEVARFVELTSGLPVQIAVNSAQHPVGGITAAVVNQPLADSLSAILAAGGLSYHVLDDSVIQIIPASVPLLP